MNRKPLVYIAGPYTKGHAPTNVLNAMAVAEKVLVKGGLPIIPHLSHYWHERYPKSLRFWYAYDLEILRMCDYCVRMLGQSVGADEEVLFATTLGIPVVPVQELHNEDFIFQTKEAIPSDHELARRGTHRLQVGNKY